MNNVALNDLQKAFIDIMNKNSIIYLVIGGKAILFYSTHRETNDLDIWISRSKNNARKLAQVFQKNNWPCPKLRGTWEDVISKKDFRLAYPADGEQKEVDVLTSIDDLDFGTVYRRSNEVILDGYNVKVPGIMDLIDMKLISLASGNDEQAHTKDRLDIEELRKLLLPKS